MSCEFNIISILQLWPRLTLWRWKKKISKLQLFSDCLDPRNWNTVPKNRCCHFKIQSWYNFQYVRRSINRNSHASEEIFYTIIFARISVVIFFLYNCITTYIYTGYSISLFIFQKIHNRWEKKYFIWMRFTTKLFSCKGGA